jgi:hypothetical protein
MICLQFLFKIEKLIFFRLYESYKNIAEKYTKNYQRYIISPTLYFNNSKADLNVPNEYVCD